MRMEIRTKVGAGWSVRESGIVVMKIDGVPVKTTEHAAPTTIVCSGTSCDSGVPRLEGRTPSGSSGRAYTMSLLVIAPGVAASASTWRMWYTPLTERVVGVGRPRGWRPAQWLCFLKSY